MERIMQINAGHKYGGVSAMLLNYYRNIDKTQFQFDFVSPYKTSFGQYKDEIEQAGGRIIELGIQGSFIQYNISLFQKVLKLCKTQKYNIVHIHSGYSLFNCVVALGCRFAGVKKIIVHSHNAGNSSSKDILYAKILKGLLCYLSNIRLACSDYAGQFMFGKRDYIVLKNGIEIKKYIFDQSIRDSIRKEYQLDDHFVIGHIGRFAHQKNHHFLILLFNEILKLNPNARLMLIGEGELFEKIVQLAKQYHIDNQIIFTGLQKDCHQFYSAFDVFVLPSFFEGLPVVGIEAQANGLKCIFSDSISPEVCLLESAKRINLDSSVDSWVKCILEKNEADRISANSIVANQGYDIKQVVKTLESLYGEE